MKSYCSYARNRDDHHKEHHDTEHGVPAKDDDDLFRRLMLEISQAGLSFDTILKKKKTIHKAFPSVKKVAKYEEKEILELMQNPGIIRNKLKINAAIYNAKKIIELQKEHGSFKKWLDKQECRNKEEWVKLFKKNFKFTGGEITNEFLMSTNYLPGAHDDDCYMKR
ncbi:DNA-3-methyladenine glycosylase I [Candidatus Woesearchaeota archaeon]|nr:DNA-3-methyladenine glycosylase I [Candidatus Woesearchaeota archaeon]MCF7901062.1 DNA-3-methyladenine glycosylase I [Candidatus Woesearchaeota archaeon]MCF8013613.1 DNA-3-methyladenine glycosylase I [Candidatus Woesearchaeota archaeon]